MMITPDCTIAAIATDVPATIRIFQEHDPFKQWWSLDELRFCRKCEHLIIGRDIRLLQDDDDAYHFRCPTLDCDATWEDWEYPDLHL